MRTIFGRQPAVIAGLIESAVLVLTTFGLDWTSEQITVTNAAVSAVLAVYVAWGVKETLSGALVQLGKAVLMLLAGFGANLGPERTSALLGFLTLAVSAWNMTAQTAIVPAPGSPPVVAGSDPVTVVSDRGATGVEVAAYVMAAALVVLALVALFGRP